MKIDLWFATPIYTHLAEKAQADEIQQEIKAILDKEYQQILTQEDAKSRSYIQSRSIEHRQVIEKYKLEKVKQHITQHAAGFIKKLHPSAQGLEIRESWFNFYHPNDSQEMHNHIHPIHPSFISGTYYIDAPEGSGDIKFYHPNFNTAITPDSESLESFEASYPPVANNLVLFRSHVAHSVMPNRSDKTRISLSFNIYIV